MHHLIEYNNVIDLGKPSYVNGVDLKIFFGRKSIVHADNNTLMMMMMMMMMMMIIQQ